MDKIKTCPICSDKYTDKDIEVNYHLQYRPVEITTDSCRGCNYAEYLIQHPEEIGVGGLSEKYHMRKRIELVREWTLKNRPLVT